jgi:hypothetical protein
LRTNIVSALEGMRRLLRYRAIAGEPAQLQPALVEVSPAFDLLRSP